MKRTAPVARQGENRLCGWKVPIIFVPGIMGSRIDIPRVSDKWDPDSKKNMLGWKFTSATNKRRLLNFDNPGVIFTNPSDDFSVRHEERVARGWGGVRWATYGAFLEFLEEEKFGNHRTPLYAYGYDWRQPIPWLGCQLAADLTGEKVNIGGIKAAPSGRFGYKGILAGEDTDKCVIITHSMGGLVTRAALKACSALRQKTIGVLHGVQPATGAPTMYRRLITGMFAPYDGGSDIESKVLRSILGVTGDEVGTLASVVPGAIQLLPSNLYRDGCRANKVHHLSWTVFEENRATPHFTRDDVIETYARHHQDHPPGVVRSTLAVPIQYDLSQRIKGLKFFHDFLADWKLAGKTWAFYGKGLGTDSTVHFDLPPCKIVKTGHVLSSDEYHAVNPAGQRVELDYEADILRNGYNPTAPHDPGGTLSGYGNHGDGTVAEISGSALFSHAETALMSDYTAETYPLEKMRQFGLDGLEHEPAFRDGQVQQFTAAWVKHVIRQLKRD
ncbi:MAG TPA: hypothetical protein VG734_03085 [Lacunisphaera sp.]|nr:hypothetical protein [Lacunisphaera sp.]